MTGQVKDVTKNLHEATIITQSTVKSILITSTHARFWRSVLRRLRSWSSKISFSAADIAAAGLFALSPSA